MVGLDVKHYTHALWVEKREFFRENTVILETGVTVWKSTIEHDDHDFYGKINIFTEEVTKEMISRNFLSVIIAFCSTTLLWEHSVEIMYSV